MRVILWCGIEILVLGILWENGARGAFLGRERRSFELPEIHF